MSVKSKEEILESIKGFIGEDSSDETISFVEDLSDTISSYEEKINDTTDWKQKYEENDKEWREKYKERFFSGGSTEDGYYTEDDNVEEPQTPKNYEDLFTIKE